MPRWLEVAKKYEGTQEVKGRASNPIILGWLHGPGKGKSWVKDDATPWCGAFMAGVMTEAGLAHTVPATPLRAKSWAEVGTPLDGPREGCIVVLPRKDKTNPDAAHVAFVVAYNAHTLWCLGGNQADAVNVSTFKRLNADGSDRGIYRWPVPIKTPAEIEADGSRIARRARRAQRDTQIATGAGTSPVTIPEMPEAPIGGLRETINGWVGDLSWLQSTLDTVGGFAAFAGHRWPILAVIVAAYFGLRVLWDNRQIREYRAQDHNEGYSA